MIPDPHSTGVKIAVIKEGRKIRELGSAIREGFIAKDPGNICVRELKAVQRVQEQYQGDRTLVHADMGFRNILVTETG